MGKTGKQGPLQGHQGPIDPESLTPGYVKRLVMDKGFGFIRDSGGTEYFFHQSAVRNADFLELREGDRVRFQPGEGQKGPRADTVVKDTSTPQN